MSIAARPTTKIVEDATCTFCGCLCDDIVLSVEDNRITEARNACSLGDAWFLGRLDDGTPHCLIDGESDTIDAGIERAARILSNAQYPIVLVVDETTTQAQRVAVSIADRIGACIDMPNSSGRGPTALAAQEVGDVTCTLGEVKDRGDLIIFWRFNPVDSHPRHLRRFSLEPRGLFVPRGRADRYCVVVDVAETATAAVADQFLAIRAGREFEAIWTLRALAKGVVLDSVVVEAETGVPLSTWQELMGRMKRARYGVLFSGTYASSAWDSHQTAHALFSLVRDMNAFARFVCVPAGEPGNAAGAENALTWQTGYPFAVSLAQGYPRFGPLEYSADEVLARQEADAALLIGGDPRWHLGPDAQLHLGQIPTVAIGFRGSSSTATVEFRTARYGIETAGTVYRCDGVTIPLRPALSSPRPSDLDLLKKLEQRLRALTAASHESTD